MSNIFDMFDNIKNLHKEIYENDKSKRECKSYIANNIAYFYSQLSTTQFVEIIGMYKDCFKNGESNIVDILKSKNIPYILAYMNSNVEITQNQIENLAKEAYKNDELVESLEYIKLLRHKYELDLEMCILKGDILRDLGGTNGAIEAYRDAKKLKSLDLTANVKIFTTYIIKYKKELIIMGALIIAIIVSQYALFNTGIISSRLYDFKIEVSDGTYIKEDENTIVIPLDSTINIDIDYKMMPFYGQEGQVSYKVDSSNIVTLDEKNNLTAISEGITQLYVLREGKIVHTYGIIVAKPEIQHIELSMDRELEQVGDIGKLETELIKNYDFDIETDLNFRSTDKRVVVVDDDGTVEIVGAGSASIIVTCGDITASKEFSISLVVEDIEVEQDIELEVDEEHKLKVEVLTNGSNKYTPKVMFSLEDTENDGNPIIRMDDSGNIKALREGTQIINVKCANLEKTVIVTVNSKDITKIQVKNLIENHEIVDNNLIINLSWDSLGEDNQYEYDIYAKFKDEEEFCNIGIATGENASYSIDYDLSNYGRDGYVEIYVVGRNDKGESIKSNDVNIQFYYKNQSQESIKEETENEDIEVDIED